MGKKQGLPAQAKGALLAMKAYGQSKHVDKAANGGKPAIDKIYSISTMDNYIKSATSFAEWARAAHGCRALKDARQHTGEYLRQRMTEGKSAWTVRADAAALAKLYQCQTTDLGAALPGRIRDNVTQHRGDTWRGHFSESRHADLVDLCRATGLRRHEVAALRPRDVHRGADGRVHVIVERGKGGKMRDVVALNDKPLQLAQAARAAGRELVIDHIPKYAPIHEYRAEFSRSMYDTIARDTAALPEKEIYRARGDKLGEVYDRKALMAVSKALGHNRLDVMMAYMR